MKRVLVTGGSGFVGSHLVPTLRAAHPNLEIHNLDLVPSVGLPVDQEHLGPLEDPSTYVPIPPVDAIVHLAAVSREPGFPTQRYYEVNDIGTGVLADWAEKVGVPKIVFYSTISVYGPVDEPTAEDAMTAPTTPYGMSKLLGEQRLHAWADRTGKALAIVRPGVIFGLGDDGNFSRLAKAVEQGWFVFPGRKDTRKAAIYVKDVVQLTEWLLGEDLTQLTVNAVYGQASTTEEIVDGVRRALAKRSTRSVVVPEGLARLGMSVLGLAESHKPPVERMFHQRRVDKLVESSNIVSQTLPNLDFNFAHSMETAILDWLGGQNSQHSA